MADYRGYIAAAGITAGEFTRTVREQYPTFSKIQTCMICAPERYGVRLVEGAEALLAARFGSYPGLSCTEAAPGEVEKQKKPRAVRTKPNRLVVYLPDEVNGKVREMMQERGYATVQDFLCTVLTNLVRIEDERKEKNHDENL